MIESLKKNKTAWQKLIAATVAALVLGLSFLSGSPDRHSNIHPEADTVEHNCVLTLFSSSSIDCDSPDTFEVDNSLNRPVQYPQSVEKARYSGLPFKVSARAPPSRC